MKPPVCELCGKRFDPGHGGGTVTFADYEPLPEGTTGHPKGLVWFCRRHLARAHALADQPTAAALRDLSRYNPLLRLLALFR